jgi:large subunit ribosomal protein L13
MTTTLSRTSDVDERWLLYDASEHVLGHMASQIAMNLMGKDRPEYTPNQCTGAYDVVINAGQVRFRGKKADVKRYVHYTGYQGGQRSIALERVLERRPTDVVRLAVRRMLPKTTLGRDMLRRLRVYAGGDHPHAAQRPERVAPKAARNPRKI